MTIYCYDTEFLADARWNMAMLQAMRGSVRG
ncbi:hypothetical protein SEA_CEPENS_63 [Mycobacterium phage Cepens]|uniref:Uncharacterized protein n=1 Tax=Mycobacterium phage Taptic TaxID=1920305 RepID=A0A1J0ME61_9CAUD|nr:hypothetical protein PQB71_gp63 [Mycobacterium phage Taptic]AVO21373.1 hypothetical protein PBI_MEGABEAR_63 [Mycobacterium phage Megabear]QBP32727.1 hypothetical protein SEA_CEPENS_63 [Mycobacterium phage Cepens]BBC28587.1 hypothetical protein [Mycobacterium phage D12]BBC28677.1 hypothetical protein [Mycobacterium phage PR]APD19293.1 hypothetical protein SEA_TAPTIC_63 [Mycobacterium phage Taptic]